MGFRYIGSKSKIIHEVIKNITDLVPKGSLVIDLMCGTANVSLALRKNGYKVIASDIMTYSYHHANVALKLSSPPKFLKAIDFINTFFVNKNPSLFPLSNYEKILLALENVPLRKGYFWKEFSAEGNPKHTEKPRNYFSPFNAKKIDGIRYWIKRLNKENQISEFEHSLLIHDLIMATNDIANISGTYGHYLSKLIGRAKDNIKLKPTIFECKSNENGHKVFQGYAEELSAQLSGDLCYIDPPYMKRQYAANYHILETLGREDEPEAIGVSGLRPWRDQYSNFCTKTKIHSSFTEIFERMNCPDFLISYSQDGLLEIEELKEFVGKFGKVKLKTFKNKRFKSNKSRLQSELNEYIIHLKR